MLLPVPPFSCPSLLPLMSTKVSSIPSESNHWWVHLAVASNVSCRHPWCLCSIMVCQHTIGNWLVMSTFISNQWDVPTTNPPLRNSRSWFSSTSRLPHLRNMFCPVLTLNSIFLLHTSPPRQSTKMTSERYQGWNHSVRKQPNRVGLSSFNPLTNGKPLLPPWYKSIQSVTQVLLTSPFVTYPWYVL